MVGIGVRRVGVERSWDQCEWKLGFEVRETKGRISLRVSDGARGRVGESWGWGQGLRVRVRVSNKTNTNPNFPQS